MHLRFMWQKEVFTACRPGRREKEGSMRKRGKNMRNCGGKQKALPGTRAVALVATFAPGALAAQAVAL